MHILRDITSLPAAAQGAALAIGNFDGVHAGHRAVLDAMKHAADAHDCPKAVMNFHPHPRRYFQRDAAPFQIYGFADNARLLRIAGVEWLFALRFNTALVQMEAREFVEALLIKQLKIRHVITGADFHFGHDREGDAALLQEYADGGAFGYRAVSLQADHGGATISSTSVRRYIAEGNMEAATSMLGRPYRILGSVAHGEKRGRMMGFPTANIPLPPHTLFPRFGVYAVKLTVISSKKEYNAVANIGIRPSFGNNEPICEVHLLNVSNMDLYGETVAISLLHFIREEQKFDGMDALKAQIALDCTAAEKRLGSINVS